MKTSILFIGLYHSLLKDSSFVYFLQKNGISVELFPFFEEEMNRFLNKIQIIGRELVCLFKLIGHFRILENRKIFCVGGHYSVLLFCRLFAFFLGGYELYLYNFYLHAAGNNKLIQRVLRFLFNNPRVTLIVQSPYEVTFYKQLSSQIRVLFVPYCSDAEESAVCEMEAKPEVNYIFTGGYTNRDYDLVFDCARRLPEQQFVVVVSSLNSGIIEDELPGNVRLYKDLSKPEFETLLSGAMIVIVPLKENVGASGQMLCLSAMQQKKPIVYSDISSINYYFTTDSGVPYAIGDGNSLLQALTYLLSHKLACEKMGDNAYQYYCTHFTNAHRDQLLYAIIKNT
jgi:glycosyltransferase involved in cell wall biosynthesis